MMTQVAIQALRAKIALPGRMEVWMDHIVTHVNQEPTARKKDTPIKKIVQYVQEESIMMKEVAIQALRVKIALLGRMEVV